MGESAFHTILSSRMEQSYCTYRFFVLWQISSSCARCLFEDKIILGQIFTKKVCFQLPFFFFFFSNFVINVILCNSSLYCFHQNNLETQQLLLYMWLTTWRLPIQHLPGQKEDTSPPFNYFDDNRKQQHCNEESWLTFTLTIWFFFELVISFYR